MSTDSNKEIVRRVLSEIWHEGNLAAIDQLFAADFVNHDPDTPDARDRAGYKVWAIALRAALPDLRITIEDLVGEGDRVAKRWTARGTHTGPLPGVGPTGRAVTFTGITIYRFEGGLVAETWWNKDTMGMLQQLGGGAVAEGV